MEVANLLCYGMNLSAISVVFLFFKSACFFSIIVKLVPVIMLGLYLLSFMSMLVYFQCIMQSHNPVILYS